MQNSENKHIKQTVNKVSNNIERNIKHDIKDNIDQLLPQNYNTVFTVLKSFNCTTCQLNPISLKLINNIWSGIGSIATTDSTLIWNNKIPSHK